MQCQGKAMLLPTRFLSPPLSATQISPPPQPKTLCQPSREQLSPLLYSSLNLCHLPSLFLSSRSHSLNRLQTTLSNPFVCLFLLQGHSGGFRNFQLPEAPGKHQRCAERGGKGGVKILREARDHGKTNSAKRHEVWRRNAVWTRSADEQ